MSFKDRERQKMLQLYQEETSNYDFHLVDVAKWAKRRGWDMPTPPTDVEILARQLQRTARTTTRKGEDVVPYRAYHAYTEIVDGEPSTSWFDIEGPAATKTKVEKALKLRREQALDVVVHIQVDENRWNRMHPDQQIELDFDFNDEVTWRLNAPGEDEQRKAG